MITDKGREPARVCVACGCSRRELRAQGAPRPLLAAGHYSRLVEFDADATRRPSAYRRTATTQVCGFCDPDRE